MADSDEAWDFYRKLHEDQPDDAEVLENLARIAGARGETKLAIQFLDGLSKIAATAEDAARYQRRVAEVHEAQNDVEAARSAYLRALDHQPDDLDALVGLNRLARASEDWQPRRRADTREPPSGRGGACSHRPRNCRNLGTKLDDAAVAMDAWRKVLELVPGDQTALTHLVDSHGHEKSGPYSSMTGRRSCTTSRVKSAPSSSRKWGEHPSSTRNEGIEAIRFLDQASLANPPSKQAAEDLERIHAGRGAWDQVVECTIRRASASEGEEAVALLLRAAQTKRISCETDAARQHCTTGFLPSRPMKTALEFKGKYLFESGDLEGAVGVFESIEALNIERDLDDFDVQMDQSLHYFNFGEALRRLGRADEAVERYEQALALELKSSADLEAAGPLHANTQRWTTPIRSSVKSFSSPAGKGSPVGWLEVHLPRPSRARARKHRRRFGGSTRRSRFSQTISMR